MKLVTSLPDVKLRQFIKSYWKIELNPRDIQNVNRIIPGIESDYIIQFGPPTNYKFIDSDWSKRKPISFLEGQFTKPFYLKFQVPATIYGIRFYSFTLPQLIKLDPSDLINDFVSTKDFPKLNCDELTETLYEVNTFDEAVLVMDKFFLDKIKFTDLDDKQIRVLVNRLYGLESNNRLSELADLFNASHRKLQLEFKSKTGMTMKHFVRSIRMQRLMRKLRTGSYTNLTELSYDLGFFDQSHMNRDFKSFSGLSPSEYIREKSPIHTSILLSENL